MDPPDLTKVVLVEHLVGDDDVDTKLLRDLASEATDYVASFAWCREVRESYYGLGVGGIVGVFLFRIVPVRNADEWVWVVVGDLPPAYIDILDAPNSACALDAYIRAMREWAAAVESGKSTEGLIPVNVAPTRESARELLVRLDFLDANILPSFIADLEPQPNS